jgi:hypothetical protein
MRPLPGGKSVWCELVLGRQRLGDRETSRSVALVLNVLAE